MKPVKFNESKGMLLVGCLVKNEGGNSWAKWEDMDTKHKHHHLVNGEQAHEVWFYTNEGEFVFTGLEATEQEPNSIWEYIQFPAVTYAIFEIDCNENQEPQIASVDKWLNENSNNYERLKFDANGRINLSDFDICYFDHRGKFGKQNIMEIWVPLVKINE